MDTQVLVDATELARLLGQAKSSVYRLAKAGLIPSFAAGPRLRGLRFDPAEVREALRRQPSGRVARDGVTREEQACNGHT